MTAPIYRPHCPAAGLFITLLSLFVTALAAAGADATLRIDYTIAGEPDGTTAISFGRLWRYEGWEGRLHGLDSIAVEGTADITVTTPDGDTLYRNSFCTLYQEWLVSGDTRGPRYMEGTALVPMPDSVARVVVALRDNRRHLLASAGLDIDPSDILIAPGRPDSSACRIVWRGSDPRPIRVAIVAEGYTEAEMDVFNDRADRAVSAILAAEPFASAADAFEFVAIATPSHDSGVSVPREGHYVSTAFDSHYSTFYSDRYLTVPSVHRLHDVTAAHGCHHIIVLANCPEYGGGGIYNFYTITTADHPLFERVVVHEFGHSFAGLADEYYYDEPDYADDSYPLDIEPWELNITTLTDFHGKWEELVESGAASLVEGGGYRSHGIWRSEHDCRMRTNDATGFCAACRLAIGRVIDFYRNR